MFFKTNLPNKGRIKMGKSNVNYYELAEGYQYLIYSCKDKGMLTGDINKIMEYYTQAVIGIHKKTNNGGIKMPNDTWLPTVKALFKTLSGKEKQEFKNWVMALETDNQGKHLYEELQDEE